MGVWGRSLAWGLCPARAGQPCRCGTAGPPPLALRRGGAAPPWLHVVRGGHRSSRGRSLGLVASASSLLTSASSACSARGASGRSSRSVAAVNDIFQTLATALAAEGPGNSPARDVGVAATTAFPQPRRPPGRTLRTLRGCTSTTRPTGVARGSERAAACAGNGCDPAKRGGERQARNRAALPDRPQGRLKRFDGETEHVVVKRVKQRVAGADEMGQMEHLLNVRGPSRDPAVIFPCTADVTDPPSAGLALPRRSSCPSVPRACVRTSGGVLARASGAHGVRSSETMRPTNAPPPGAGVTSRRRRRRPRRASWRAYGWCGSTRGGTRCPTSSAARTRCKPSRRPWGCRQSRSVPGVGGRPTRPLGHLDGCCMPRVLLLPPTGGPRGHAPDPRGM